MQRGDRPTSHTFETCETRTYHDFRVWYQDSTLRSAIAQLSDATVSHDATLDFFFVFLTLKLDAWEPCATVNQALSQGTNLSKAQPGLGMTTDLINRYRLCGRT